MFHLLFRHFVPPSGSKKPERNGTHKRFGFVPPCVPLETYYFQYVIP
jgi:hypothetical protein